MNTLNDRIQSFYDASTQLWLDTWGEHMHHGYYGAEGRERKDHRQAQIDLVMELLQWGGVEEAGHILDAGCGVGGSARLLASLYDAGVLGVTLSPVQAERGRRYNREAGLEDKVRIEARDMMSLRFDDGPFDLIWSLESAEHIEDKEGLLELFYELLEPGGHFIMATWCHRDTPPRLSGEEVRLLEKLYRLYHLPPMIPVSRFETLARQVGFEQVKAADWSDAVAPFWKAVIRSAFSTKGISGLLRSGWSTFKGAWAMRYMTKGYRQGTIKFGLVQGKKP